MLLYLVRHGKAEPGHDDALRSLTRGGREEVERVARHLADRQLAVDAIEHSPLRRAHETAEIIARYVPGSMESVSGLLPESAVQPVAGRLHGDRRQAVMLVGHMPFMSNLASFLLVDRPNLPLFHFRTGAILCLSNDEGPWQVEWFLSRRVV